MWQARPSELLDRTFQPASLPEPEALEEVKNLGFITHGLVIRSTDGKVLWHPGAQAFGQHLRGLIRTETAGTLFRLARRAEMLPSGNLAAGQHGDVPGLEVIFHLVKEQGYTLAGAKRYLKEEKGKIRQKQDALKTLKRLRGFLEDLKI